MGPRRRVHRRTQLHAFAEKGPSGQRSGRPDPKRRPHSPSRRLRGTTTILRVHLPKALEVPQSIARLNAGKPPTVSSDEANFLSALDWRQLLNMGMNTDSISISVIEAPVVSSLGVARSLDFMGAVRQTAELSLLSAEIEEPDAYLFVRSVSNLVRWRFSIHLPAIQERFLNVAAVMFRSAELPLKLPPAPGAYQLYLDRVRGLLQEWQSWGRTAETLSR